MKLEFRLNKAKEVAYDAGSIILERTTIRDFGIEYKPDGSPVTGIDKDVEYNIRETLLNEFPTNSFVGEELDPVKGTDYFTWCCDPIDGTWGIIHGEKTVSTSLALYEKNKLVLGVVYNPFTDEMFTGAEGLDTKLNGELIPNYSRTEPEKAVYNFQISINRNIKDVSELYRLRGERKIAKLISRGGSIAYNLAQVAEGSHSVYIAASSRPAEIWDIAAGIYLVKSVGGEVSHFDEKRVLIASTNPEIHQKTLDMLKKTDFRI